MKRPLGVWIIGILAIINGILSILAGITALGVGGLAMMGKIGEDTGNLGAEALGVGIVTLIVGIIVFIFALAFLGLRPWAWTALMIFEVLTIVIVIIQFIFGGFHWNSLVTLIIPLIIVLYMTRPGVRGAFSQ